MYNERTTVIIDGVSRLPNTSYLLYQVPWDFKITNPIIRVTNRSNEIMKVCVAHVSNIGVLPVPANYILYNYDIKPYSFYDVNYTTMNALSCIYVSSDKILTDFDMIGNMKQLYGVDIFGSSYSGMPSGYGGSGFSGYSGWSGYSGYSGSFDADASVDGGYF